MSARGPGYDLNSGDYDRVGFAVLHNDGETLTLIDPLPPDLVDVIRTSAHRLEVRVRFVAENERFRGPDGAIL